MARFLEAQYKAIIIFLRASKNITKQLGRQERTMMQERIKLLQLYARDAYAEGDNSQLQMAGERAKTLGYEILELVDQATEVHQRYENNA
jgi:hypothetical protein